VKKKTKRSTKGGRQTEEGGAVYRIKQPGLIVLSSISAGNRGRQWDRQLSVGGENIKVEKKSKEKRGVMLELVRRRLYEGRRTRQVQFEANGGDKECLKRGSCIILCHHKPEGLKRKE